MAHAGSVELSSEADPGWDPAPPERDWSQRTLGQIWRPVVVVVVVGALVAAAAVFVPFVVLSNELDGVEGFPGAMAACEDPSADLALAATNDDAAEVARLAAEDPTAVNRSRGGWTPLLCAVDHGSARAAGALLAVGADPDLAVGGRAAPVSIAAADGDQALVQALLEAGADPSSAAGGTTPLVEAIRASVEEGDEVDVVGALLAAGADPSAVDERGESPLLWAAWQGDAEAAAVLLDAGADPDQVLSVDGHVVELAFAPRLPVEADIEALAPLADGRGEVRALHAAAGTGDAEVVQVLLAAGADPGAVAYGAFTPLHLAEAVGDEEVAALLLLAGADPEAAPDPVVGTPSDLAAAVGTGR